jgi:hypothetical protein
MIVPFCKQALCVFHAIAWLILHAHAQTNFPPVVHRLFDACHFGKKSVMAKNYLGKKNQFGISQMWFF